MIFACYSSGTGEILIILNTTDVGVVKEQGHPYLEVDDSVGDDSHYVDLSSSSPKVRAKESLDTSHTVNGLSVDFEGLPPGTKVEVEGRALIADGKDDGIEFETPGTYFFDFSPPPMFLPTHMEVVID
ncbi:MAG: hypothetical protein ACQEW0_16545 [Pseudomonadota bacterium]